MLPSLGLEALKRRGSTCGGVGEVPVSCAREGLWARQSKSRAEPRKWTQASARGIMI